jgi:hypothetical protein
MLRAQQGEAQVSSSRLNDEQSEQRSLAYPDRRLNEAYATESTSCHES